MRNKLLILTLVLWTSYEVSAAPAPAPAGLATSVAGKLAQRVLGERAGDFVFQPLPKDHARDVFEIESARGKVIIRGSSGVAMAVGLNWYLKYHALCDVSWCGRQTSLPSPLPRVPAKIRRVCRYPRRYLLNYCCFGYSLPWWDWSQWEQLIDWMALNGVNMPLAVTGQEAVWQAVCKRLGLTDAQVRAFLAGPPYLPFGWMGCLDGWGGPLPQGWIDRHVELQKKILARQRELGMTPVLQGFTGHVPPGVKAKFPKAKLHSIHWIEWHTSLLDPLDPLYAKIAAMFMEEQTKRFGTDHLYAADTFIEMTPPSGDVKFLGDLGKAIYDGMARTDPKAVWVLQGWTFMFKRSFWTQPRIRAFLDATPNDRMIVLDLFCEARPMWNQTEAFCGKPWVWCNIQSFGRTVRLGGALNRIVTDLPAAGRDPKAGRLVGVGFVNEGLDDNPVVYDLMFEMPWRDRPIDLNDWVRNYSRRRCGRANADAERAWRILKDTVYNAPNRTRSIIDHVPTLRTGRGRPPYSNVSLSQVWRLLLGAADELSAADTYRFDLVNVARQVLSNHAAILHADVVTAYQKKNHEQFKASAQRFLQLIRDLDELLATRKEFLLGRCLANAKRWGRTDAEHSARFEWNARRVLTLWGTGRAIRDYARKEWSGMLSGFYFKRWQRFLGELGRSLEKGAKPFDNAAFQKQLYKWEHNWADQRDVYPSRPQGDSVAIARKLWTKYGPTFRPDAISLTTGKPVTRSFALPSHPAHLANDGHRNNTNSFWATDTTKDKKAWWQVDLQKPTTVGRVVVVGYYGDKRHYGFIVEVSLDGKKWQMVADHRTNKTPATRDGHTCRFPPRPVRYIRITQPHNSANTGRHLVEVMAFER